MSQDKYTDGELFKFIGSTSESVYDTWKNLYPDGGDEAEFLEFIGGDNHAQADWNETDESSPAFIMNKPTSLDNGNGSSVVKYWYSLGHWYDEEGRTVQVTEDEIINNFLNGVVRFQDKYSSSDSWGTMIGYYYYTYSVAGVMKKDFTIVYTNKNNITTARPFNS